MIHIITLHLVVYCNRSITINSSPHPPFDARVNHAVAGAAFADLSGGGGGHGMSRSVRLKRARNSVLPTPQSRLLTPPRLNPAALTRLF